MFYFLHVNTACVHTHTHTHTHTHKLRYFIKRYTCTSNCHENYTGLEKKRKSNLPRQENLLVLDDTV